MRVTIIAPSQADQKLKNGGSFKERGHEPEQGGRADQQEEPKRQDCGRQSREIP